MGESVKYVGRRADDHVSVTVKGTILSVCEHGEGPLLLSPTAPSVLRTEKEAGVRLLDLDQLLGS